MQAIQRSLLSSTAITSLFLISLATPVSANVQGVCVQNCGPAPSPYRPPIYVRPPEPSPTELQQQQANVINDQGLAAENRHDYAGAIALFEQALRLSTNPNSTSIIRENIARAYGLEGFDAFNRNDHAGAIEVYKQALAYTSDARTALTLRQNIANCYSFLANAAGRRNDLIAELEILSLAMRYNPENPEWARWENNIRGEISRRQEAIAEERQQAAAERQRAKTEAMTSAQTARDAARQQLKADTLARAEEERKAARRALEQPAGANPAQGSPGGNTKFFGTPVGPGPEAASPTIPQQPQTTYPSTSAQLNAAAIRPEAAACVFEGQAGCPAGQSFEPLKLSSNSADFKAVSARIATNKKLVADEIFINRFNWYRHLDQQLTETKSKLSEIQQQIDTHKGDQEILKVEKETLANTAKSLEEDQAKAKQFMDERAETLSIKIDWQESGAPNAQSPAPEQQPPKPAEPKTNEPKTSEPKMSEPKTNEPKPTDKPTGQ
jgi:tetratricopeptide (TPR) repeat protein